MIDIESVIYTKVRQAVLDAFPSAGISSVYVENPSSFPHVSFVESGNSTYERTETLGSIENHAQLMFQCDIYSNDKTSAKSICKSIAAVVDGTMLALNFRRTTSAQIPNIDRAIYRITLRYEGVVSRGIPYGSDTYYSIYSS